MSSESRTDPIKGRGSRSNPANRFERLAYERDDEFPDEGRPRATQFYRDHSRSLIAYNSSPDIRFDASINAYRGCEHGCTYCYARPFHEYLGFSAGLDFETRILVKEDAPAMLRRELSARSWTPQPIALSGITDPYQPAERRLRLTRSILEVLSEFRNPVQIITKNELVLRDIDFLRSLAEFQAVNVMISIPSRQAELVRRLEPRTTIPERRMRTIEMLAREGIPVGIGLSPVIPAMTDMEIPALVSEAADRGACYAVCIPLRLSHGVADLFAQWLAEYYPDRKEKVLARVREIRGGKLNDARFGSRMRGEGVYARQIMDLFHAACRKAGLDSAGPPLSAEAFRRPSDYQYTLF